MNPILVAIARTFVRAALLFTPAHASGRKKLADLATTLGRGGPGPAD